MRSDWRDLAEFAQELTHGYLAALGTWRWRLGNALLSLPRRLLLRRAQPMVTDAMRRLILEHRERRADFSDRHDTLQTKLARRRDEDLGRIGIGNDEEEQKPGQTDGKSVGTSETTGEGEPEVAESAEGDVDGEKAPIANREDSPATDALAGTLEKAQHPPAEGAASRRIAVDSGEKNTGFSDVYPFDGAETAGEQAEWVRRRGAVESDQGTAVAIGAGDESMKAARDEREGKSDLTTPFAHRRPAQTIIDRLGDARDDSVDVIVCVHNALPDVRRCLDSVLARTTGNYRLVIVNDGSDGETTEYLRAFCGSRLGIRLIETLGPLGYTRAANAGMRESKADHVVLLNSDTVVPSLWLERLLECMTSDDGIGVVGPLSNAASWQSVPAVVGSDGGWAVNELPPGYDVDSFAELVACISAKTFPKVDFVNGFCFMIRREVMEAVGLLDATTFPKGYGEENDYCLRAADIGFSLAIADHCYVLSREVAELRR